MLTVTDEMLTTFSSSENKCECIRRLSILNHCSVYDIVDALEARGVQISKRTLSSLSTNNVADKIMTSSTTDARILAFELIRRRIREVDDTTPATEYIRGVIDFVEYLYKEVSKV